MKSKEPQFSDRLRVLLAIIRKNKTAVLAVLFLGIVTDILAIPASSDLRTFFILGVYAGASKLYKLKSRLTFFMCLVLLGLMFTLFLITGTSSTTEKAAVWLVLFWAIGIIQQWRE